MYSRSLVFASASMEAVGATCLDRVFQTRQARLIIPIWLGMHKVEKNAHLLRSHTGLLERNPAAPRSAYPFSVLVWRLP